jgi:hypothetical protein
MISKEEILTSEIRALSWKQPFAELMKHGKQETRTWATEFRGLVLICASVQPYGDRELVEICGPEQHARILQILGPKWFNQVKRGSAIAVGRINGCVEMWRSDEGVTFVKYKPGLYVHRYEDITPIQPFPWRGQLGWKTLTQEERERIEPILNL